MWRDDKNVIPAIWKTTRPAAALRVGAMRRRRRWRWLHESRALWKLQLLIPPNRSVSVVVGELRPSFSY